VKISLECWLQQADYLPVDVIDGCCEEKKCADEPAIVPDSRRGADLFKYRCRCCSLFLDRHITSDIKTNGATDN
jgi:hypothetical protein